MDDTIPEKCLQKKNKKRKKNKNNNFFWGVTKKFDRTAKTLTHTHDFNSKFECSVTGHFKGVLAFYIIFFQNLPKLI